MNLHYAVGFACLFFLPEAGLAGILLTNNVPSYSQDFDTLANSGATGTTLPSGWVFSESGGSANFSYGVGTGSSTTGNTYSFGLASDTDRALGGLQTGTLIPVFGVSFQNGGTSSILDFSITYVGEQWRVGATTRLDRLDFQFSVDATSLSTGIWSDLNSLDFARSGGLTVGASNGNLVANRQSLTSTLSNANLAVGDTIWIRWQDFDATGFDDGLAIDDFQVTANFAPASVPEPATGALLGAIGLLVWRLRRRSSSVKQGSTSASRMPSQDFDNSVGGYRG